MSAEERYDGFQQEAVNSIVADFKERPAGRFLLVIPTGGGKTYTAVKAVSKLYDTGHLAKSDRVLWVVHRDELRSQASDTFRDFATKAGRPELPEHVDVVMLSAVKEYLLQNPTVRIAVVDEAHHVAAASYQPLFERRELGILGLTATPSRHDGKPLQFDRESYSIGFPDLIDIGVLLRPEVIKIDGGKYDIDDIGVDSAALEALNNVERNTRILGALNENQAKLHKVIIYVGTKQHAQDLFALLKASPFAGSYESIGMILGGERRRFIPSENAEFREDRAVFIKAMKDSIRALLVNVDVLTEGFDDKTVNTVVMARPTNSKLVYMQAMGRAVRLDPANPEKAAYVLEVTDDLPNIRYRIDNRWLFSDVSDALEPEVVDLAYPSFERLPGRLLEFFKENNVPEEARALPAFNSRDRVTVLLFKVYSGGGAFYSIPVVIVNDTRQAAANFFNFLSARMKTLVGMAPEEVIASVKASIDRFPVLANKSYRKNVLGAMDNAWYLIDGSANDTIRTGRPWITFASFRLRAEASSLTPDLVAFTEDMVNRDWVRETLLMKSYTNEYVLVRLPLPLKGTWGSIFPPQEFEGIRATVDRLKNYADEPDALAQWKASVDVMGSATLPVETRHQQGLTTIVRESLDYFRPLAR